MKIFHGWWIVVAGFVCTLLAIGSTTYAFGLFVKPLAQEFSLSRADANGAFIALLIGFALWAPIVGRLLDRAPARLVMVGGAVLFAGGFALIAALDSPRLMGLVIVGPVALGTVACGALAANTLTARWFARKRGRALGLLAIATSAGGFIMPPLIALLMQHFGWRWALVFTGLLVLALVSLFVLWLVRDRPASLGLLADGDAAPALAPTPAAAAAAAAAAHWPFRRLLAHRDFWLISLGAGLLLGGDQALLASIIPYGTDAGFSPAQAALLMSCLTFSAMLGKLLIGFVADRVDKRYLFCAIVVCNVSFLAMLLSTPGFPLLLSACCIIGIAIGGTYPIWMTLTADTFGSASFGAVMGTMNLVTMPFAIAAIRYVGEVFDRTGGYGPAFQLFMATAGLAALLVLAVGRKPGPAQPGPLHAT